MMQKPIVEQAKLDSMLNEYNEKMGDPFYSIAKPLIDRCRRIIGSDFDYGKFLVAGRVWDPSSPPVETPKDAANLFADVRPDIKEFEVFIANPNEEKVVRFLNTFMNDIVRELGAKETIACKNPKSGFVGRGIHCKSVVVFRVT